jgi:methylenetetrahydrofolate reductase (NADPH)
VREILEIESKFAAEDWRQFAQEIQYPQDGEFYLYDRDPVTGLADPSRLEPGYEASLKDRVATHNVTLGYRFSKWVHDAVFTPGTALNRLGKRVYASSANTFQGPRPLRILEHVGKSAMFGCKDCGDCSLDDVGYLCPESQCAKNQRNGPCGGTRNGKCEVYDFECIWSRAYDRAKFEGREQQLLEHSPVIQDESLRGTSSWANYLLGRDHHSQEHHTANPAPDIATKEEPSIQAKRSGDVANAAGTSQGPTGEAAAGESAVGQAAKQASV